MTASAYVNILLDVVATLQDTVGVGGTVRALRLGHAMAPEGVTEYDASLRIAELTNSARVATERRAGARGQRNRKRPGPFFSSSGRSAYVKPPHPSMRR